MPNTIILIGPMSAGKTTIATLLAEELETEHISLDDFRWEYFDEIGYDIDEGSYIYKTQGLWGLFKHWKGYEAHAVERVLEDFEDVVIAFGAGHSVYDDKLLMKRVKQALAPYPNVILLLPSPDAEASIATLNARLKQATPAAQFDPVLLELNAYLVKHAANRKLAKITIYTDGKTPDDVMDEILDRLVLEGDEE